MHFSFAAGSVPPLDRSSATRLGAALASLHRASAAFHSSYQRFQLNLDTLLWRPLATVTQVLTSLNMPTRTDITSLAERLTNIEKRLDDLDAKLEKK